MSINTPIPVTDVAGQQTFNFPTTSQAFSFAQITLERSGTGGTHPWLNQLTPADTLDVEWQWSADGQTWNSLSADTFHGGSTVVKGVTVPQESGVSVGIGRVFPAGTHFRAILTASTPVTFSGSAIYG